MISSDGLSNTTNVLIGIIVGVGICFLLIFTIVLIIVLLRRKRAQQRLEAREIILKDKKQSQNNDKHDQTTYVGVENKAMNEIPSQAQNTNLSIYSDTLPPPDNNNQENNIYSTFMQNETDPKIQGIKKWIIDFKQLELETKVGSGNFGEVWKGKERNRGKKNKHE